MNCCPRYSVQELMVQRGIPQSLQEIKQIKKQWTETIITSYYSAGRTAALANLFPLPDYLR